MTSRRPPPTPDPLGESESTSRNALPDEPAEERTAEWSIDAMDAEFVELEPESRDETSGRAVAEMIDDGSAGAATPFEKATRRERRDTLPSALPSLLARSMRRVGVPRPDRPPGPPPGRLAVGPIAQRGALANALARDPAAPAAEHSDVTRRVVGAEAHAIPSERHSAGYSIEMGAEAMGDVHSAPTAEQRISSLAMVGTLVKKACSSLDAGDVAQAVLAASAAVEASGGSVEGELGDLNDTASGPLARIFTAGPISKVPVTRLSDAQLDALVLDELHWALLRRLDGQLTFDQVFRATKIPAIDALKIAAALLRDGVIAVHDRATH